MSGQGREEKGLFPKGMILACVILFLLGIGCVGMNLAAGPSEEKNPMGQIADYRKKEEKKKEAEKYADTNKSRTGKCYLWKSGNYKSLFN